jgi:hypothetical protein
MLTLVITSINAQPVTYISTIEAQSDIDQLIASFERIHYNPYFKTSKEELLGFKNKWVSDWTSDSIKYKAFIAVGMKLSAIMSGGHSYLYWRNEKILPEIKSQRYIPFTGKPSKDGQTLVVTKSSIAELEPGMAISTINGIKATDLFKECMAYNAGIEGFKIASTERIFPLYLFFIDQLKPPYAIEFQSSNEILNIEGIDVGELANFINSSQVQVDYSFEIVDDNVGLIHYNSCNNYKKFRKFLEQTFSTIAEKNIDKLIIDIRENGGGDSRLNDLLLTYITTKPYQQSSGRYWKVSREAKKAYASNKVYAKMFGAEFMEEYMSTPDGEVIETLDSSDFVVPEKPKNYFEGRSCVLIGPSTFSSANFLADAVKTFNLTTLIGTPTGEYTNDFGEQISFTLNNSGSLVFISSTYDIGANGDATILEPVSPDIYVENDVLEYAMDWIKNDDK